MVSGIAESKVDVKVLHFRSPQSTRAVDRAILRTVRSDAAATHYNAPFDHCFTIPGPHQDAPFDPFCLPAVHPLNQSII